MASLNPLDKSKKPAATPSPQCISRIKRDLMSIYTDPPPGIYVVPDSSNLTILHALIVGSPGTPYEGGFFYFFMRCPGDYPIRPPQVKLMTTGAGTVRFNPHLYSCGKVCLSILGTFPGPAWSPAQSLSSVLVSIQSLMNEKPFYNEHIALGSEQASDQYNEYIQHETIRVAVCGMVANDTNLNIPPALKEVIEKKFLELYDFYLKTVEKKSNLNKREMYDSYENRRDKFKYGELKKRLQDLRSKYPSGSKDSANEDFEMEVDETPQQNHTQ